MSGESVLRECSTVSYKSVPARLSHKSDPQERSTNCPTRVLYKSVLRGVPHGPQECPARAFHKSVQQECPRVSYKSVPQECSTRVSHKSVLQEFSTRVSHKSVLQECPTKESRKSVLQECPGRVSYKNVPQECPTRGSVMQGVPTRVHKSVLRGFPARMNP